MIKDVTDLDIYNNALKNLPSLYDLADQIPELHKKLKIQVIQSAESIPALIAEGYGKKRSEKEFKRFLEMALGSSDETISHIRVIQLLGCRFKSIDNQLSDDLIEKYKQESRQISTLIKTWKTYH